MTKGSDEFNQYRKEMNERMLNSDHRVSREEFLDIFNVALVVGAPWWPTSS